MKKMNNKGFSLVELIVVVLIMAIIAVALAPQVMKWVENSRLSTDRDTYEQFISNLQIALTDKNLTTVSETTFTLKGDGIYVGDTKQTGSNSAGTIQAALDAVAADWYKAVMKSSTNKNTNPTVTVNASKMISRGVEPAAVADAD
jgi:type IV pilus assembly protein PilA